MPNWCMNRLLIEGENEDILRFAKYVSGVNGILDFEKAMPIPDNCENIRDWCMENWGTKWTPDCDPTPDEDEELYMSFAQQLFFNTAWTPPLEFFNTIAKQFPEMGFHLDYLEIGCAFAGESWWENGELAGDCEYNDTDPEYLQLASEVFGIESGDEDD